MIGTVQGFDFIMFPQECKMLGLTMLVVGGHELQSFFIQCYTFIGSHFQQLWADLGNINGCFGSK